MVGGLLLGISVFVKAYEAQPENPNATLETGAGGVCGDHTCSFFQVHTISRWLMLAAAAGAVHPRLDHHPRAPALVAARAGHVGRRDRRLRDHPLHGHHRPAGRAERRDRARDRLVRDDPRVVADVTGSVMRQQETEVKRKPPGTL